MKLFTVSFYEMLLNSKYIIYSATEGTSDLKNLISCTIDNFISSVQHNDDTPYFGVRVLECDDDMTVEKLEGYNSYLREHEDVFNNIQEQIYNDKYNLKKYDINADEKELITYNELLEVLTDYWMNKK